ncbi:zinc finger protein 845-like [Odontomachus brunneus]|uniref:zinc finger protein 845-like n=1 Tax=Odontomachus brunneus TaxID=486640 RepID=UPI0013F23B33|nr:zinc finger protein 845-like [Odontomachus brunneus]
MVVHDPLEDPLYFPYYENFIGTSIDSPIVTDADDSKYKIEIVENFNLQEELNRDIKKDHELSDNSYDNMLPRESIQNVSLSENSNTSVTDRPEAYDVNSGVIARVEPEFFSKCTACHKRFRYKADFEKHRNLNDCLQCETCYQKFDLLEDFSRHIKIHRKSMSYDCYMCSYKTDTVKYLTEHMKSEHNTTDICKCVICSKTFSRRSNLKKHKEIAHADNTQSIKCDKCDGVFKNKYCLKIHQRRIHSEANFFCKRCGFTFKTQDELDQHNAERHDWTCPQCNKKILVFSNIEPHLRLHRNEKPFICDTCGNADPLVDPLYIPDSKSVNDQSMASPSVPDANNLECSSVENSVDSSLYKSKLRRRRKTTLASRKESHCHAMQDSRRHSRRQNVKRKKINEKMKSYSKCGTCGKCFSWDAMVKHLNEPKYSCQNCRQVFCVEVQLNRHVATVHGEPIYSCSICEYKSKNKRTLTDHFIRKHTEEDQFSCNKQLAIQDGQEQQANRVRSGKSSITCSICGHVSKNVRAIKAHMKYRHYKPQFVCEICRRGLTTQKNLEQHLEWHETRENKECPTCHKKCRVRDLKQHMQTHSDAKLFSCPVCDKTFREQYYREQHMLLHTGKKPYICSICNLTFTQKRRLIAHRKTHPGPLPPLPVVPVEKIIAEFMKKYTKKNTINKNNTK